MYYKIFFNGQIGLIQSKKKSTIFNLRLILFDSPFKYDRNQAKYSNEQQFITAYEMFIAIIFVLRLWYYINKI